MKCYILNLDYDHLNDMDADAFYLPFEGEDHFDREMTTIKDFEAPKHLFLLADFEMIPEYDYPVTDLTIPVMSTKMLNVLKGIRNFKHLAIPITMIDDTYLDDQFEDNGKLKSDVPFNDEYAAIQIKEYTDVFNRDKSIFKDIPGHPGKIRAVEKLILKTPPSGFPPIFRMEENRMYLFVSQEAKDALEAEGIMGCIFEPVEVAD